MRRVGKLGCDGSPPVSGRGPRIDRFRRLKPAASAAIERDRNAGRLRRCPECGALVRMPCRACAVMALPTETFPRSTPRNLEGRSTWICYLKTMIGMKHSDERRSGPRENPFDKNASDGQSGCVKNAYGGHCGHSQKVLDAVPSVRSSPTSTYPPGCRPPVDHRRTTRPLVDRSRITTEVTLPALTKNVGAGDVSPPKVICIRAAEFDPVADVLEELFFLLRGPRPEWAKRRRSRGARPGRLEIKSIAARRTGKENLKDV